MYVSREKNMQQQQRFASLPDTYIPRAALPCYRATVHRMFSRQGEGTRKAKKHNSIAAARTFRVEVVPLCRVRCLGGHWRFGTTSVAPNGNLGPCRTGILLSMRLTNGNIYRTSAGTRRTIGGDGTTQPRGGLVL
jgi:hypothetical protein